MSIICRSLSKKSTMSQRGEAIRFTTGKYKGRTGWVNSSKPKTAKMMSVIVDLGNGVTRDTRVRQTSVAAPFGPPKSFQEALLQQHPDIEELIDKVASKLAKCTINEESLEPFTEFFGRRVKKACERQEALGNKATWLNVEWDDD